MAQDGDTQYHQKSKWPNKRTEAAFTLAKWNENDGLVWRFEVGYTTAKSLHFEEHFLFRSSKPIN